jgi:predicted secreted protein
MSIPIGSILAIYVVVWWICFMAVLPVGQQSQHEAGNVVAGTDPAAPVLPGVWRKAFIATGLSVLLTLLLFWATSNETLYHYWNR